VSAKLAAAQDFERRITRRAAESWTELPLGWEARHRALADVHHLNTLLLRAPLPAEVGASELMALAEARQSDLRHRRVMLDDEAAGERVSGGMLDAGWERDRTLYMALGSDPKDALSDPRARVLPEEQLRAVQHATLGEDDFGPLSSPGLIDRLVEAQAALRAGTRALGFGAGPDERVVSHCTLFCEAEPTDRRVALIDTVGTLRAYRQQGLAKAVVSAAVRAAGEWGADLVVVPADADDWPQLLYAGLGFAPLGRQVGFTRQTPSGSGFGGR
jgi:GNAT superfamily N-acetyltransferase